MEKGTLRKARLANVPLESGRFHEQTCPDHAEKAPTTTSRKNKVGNTKNGRLNRRMVIPGLKADSFEGWSFRKGWMHLTWIRIGECIQPLRVCMKENC